MRRARRIDKWHNGVSVVILLFCFIALFLFPSNNQRDFDQSSSTPTTVDPIPENSEISQQPIRQNIDNTFQSENTNNQITSSVSNLALKIEKNKKSAHAMELQLQKFDDQINDYIAKMDSYKSSEMVEEYNKLVPEVNDMISERKDLYQEYKDLINTVNAEVQRYNSGER
ncbi:MAG: hypothetical protein WCI64_10725 [Chlorobium sp.]